MKGRQQRPEQTPEISASAGETFSVRFCLPLFLLPVLPVLLPLFLFLPLVPAFPVAMPISESESESVSASVHPALCCSPYCFWPNLFMFVKLPNINESINGLEAQVTFPRFFGHIFCGRSLRIFQFRLQEQQQHLACLLSCI